MILIKMQLNDISAYVWIRHKLYTFPENLKNV